jgi:dipeptidyl aminopeptidase/acylaminoacyl peptidase
MNSRHIDRAEPARAFASALRLALAAAFAFATLPLHAAQTETRSLKPQLARIAAMPAAPRIADEDFSRRSRLNQVKLSPDGAWLAFFEGTPQSYTLNVLDVRSGQKKPLLTLTTRHELHWSGDSSTIFLDSGDALAALPVGGGASARVAAFDRKAEQQFVAVDPSHPKHALTDGFDRAAKAYRITRVGADGASKLIYEGDRKVGEFLLDTNGDVAFIRTLDKDFSQVVSRKVGGKWLEATRCKRLRACQLVAASSDQRYLTMVVNHQDDRRALVQLDLDKKTTRVLHTDPLAIADLRQAMVSPASGQPLFAVYDLPARRNFGLTEATRRAAADVAKRFPDANVTIGASEMSPRWLLTERSARLAQERFWLYDVATRKIAPVLEAERAAGQALPEDQLAHKIPLHYRASDGVLIHGYLTIPPGKQASTLPVMTLVHGGPWGRFDNDYTSLVQLLANRGYAVFQPNFRASTGYGDKYLTAPKADFGNGRVQADIIDGVRWLLAQGVGDKDRLGIMGDSFGGYSVLQALTHTPGMFRFGVATVPPPEFGRTMVKASAAPDQPDEVPFSVRLVEMGIDLNDAAAMKRIADQSPAANTEKLRRPLLILAGGQDKMVEVATVTDYVARLQGLNKPVTLLLDPDEGHNPRKPMFRAAYSYLLQKMLHEHLGGPAPTAPSTELAGYLQQMVKVNGAMKGL